MPEDAQTAWLARCSELTSDRLGRATLARTQWKITGIRRLPHSEGGGARVDLSWTSPDVETEFTKQFQDAVSEFGKDVVDVMSGKPSSEPDPFVKNYDAMVLRVERGEVAQKTSLFVFDVAKDGRITSAPIPAP